MVLWRVLRITGCCRDGRAAQQDLAALLLEKASGIKSVEQQNGQLTVEMERQTHDFSHLARLLLDNNFRIREIKEEEVNLETAFMRLTKGMVQ